MQLKDLNKIERDLDIMLKVAKPIVGNALLSLSAHMERISNWADPYSRILVPPAERGARGVQHRKHIAKQ